MTTKLAAPTPVPDVLIVPEKGWSSLGLKDVWAYRELLYFLVWRDVKVRYKQTLLGVAWAVLQPLLTMVVFTIFFGRLANVGSDGLPVSALLASPACCPGPSSPSGSASRRAASSARRISSKRSTFPRLVIPASSVLAAVVDFALAFVLLLGMMAYYHVVPPLTVLLIPFLLVLAIATTLGVGIWLSALNVQYRDVRYVVPFFVQMWLFVTPVIYPGSRVTAKLAEHGLPAWVYGFNPMAGVVEGFRWALLGSSSSPGALIATSTIVSAVILVSGMYYFRRMERIFADVV